MAGKSRTGPYAEELPRTPQGYTIKPRPYGVWKDGILWNSSSVGKLAETFDERIHTVYDLVNNCFNDYANNRCAGTRQLISRDMVEDPPGKGKKFEKLTLGEYSWITYGQWLERIQSFGKGLFDFAQLAPKDRVLIYAETQRDWMTSALSCYQHNLTVVTAYATLGAEAAAFAVNQTKSRVIVADNKLLGVVLKVHDLCPNLKYVVTIEEASGDVKGKLEAAGISVASMDELIEKGKASSTTTTPPAKDDIAVLMFTSGTTGNPKGVVLLHECLISAVSGISHIFGPVFDHNDVYCAYLPLAHIMEMIAELCLLTKGVSMGYGNPHTLTNTGIKLARGQLGDLVVLRPTVVVFAPLVLEKIYNGICAKVDEGGAFKKWMFNQAMNAGLKNFDNGQIGAPGLWNSLVFKKIQQMTGGNLRFVLTGSAPLDGNVQKFVQTCLCCPVRQGYGATETSAASVVQEFMDNSVSSVGPPRVSCCVKLVDWDEGGYRFTDIDNPEIGKHRGEIVIGGALVAAGYLVDPENPDPEIEEKNRTDFKTDENGMRWFYTGDIGQVDENGCLAIIDRKKDLVKLQQGEYVALSKVEGVLKLSPFVENAMVHASSDQKYCTALICPQFKELHKFCHDHNLGDDMDAACTNPQVIEAVFRSCQEVSRGKLVGFEIPAKITLVPSSRTWSPENDLLTAAMKLKRKPIISAHKDDIAKMYA